MICKECKSQGLKSRVYDHGSVSTAMGITHYFDEDDVEHWHDPNQRSTMYSCSNGHGFTMSTRAKCSAKGCTFAENT